MAKAQVQRVPADALSYSAQDWLKYGDIAEPSTQEKMIMLAIEEIIALGPADFNAMDTCDRLGIKHPMVNYYFGNRDGLLAAATWWAFQQWAKSVDSAFRSSPRNPRKRLENFIKSEIAWAKRMGGMHVLMNYPIASFESQKIVASEYQEHMQRIFEYHLALVAVTVRDIRKGTVNDLDFTVENYPKAELMRSPSIVLAATHISWMTHGIATWSSGNHLATEGLAKQTMGRIGLDAAMRGYIKEILRLAQGQ